MTSENIEASIETNTVNADNAYMIFYDIESLSNAFTMCAYDAKYQKIHLYYLLDDDLGVFDTVEAARLVRESNPAYKGDDIRFYDLHDLRNLCNLAAMIGLSNAQNVNDPFNRSDYLDEFRPVCDTDPDYDPINTHPFLAGYNSSNYDTTMLALLFYESMPYKDTTQNLSLWKPVTAQQMRRHNNALFTKEFKKSMPSYLKDSYVAGGKGWNATTHRIRKAMISSGRHLDVAQLNEKQKFVGLKRLLGTLGHQILESDQLSGHNSEVKSLSQVYELLAYNASDCINLEKLFHNPIYANAFNLKIGLLDEFPELIYKKQASGYKPDINPKQVRGDRLTPDSTSARFAATFLSPYGKLNDMESVSYWYPEKSIAQAKGIEQIHVLTEIRNYFYSMITNEGAREQFDKVYEYYSSIEGKNFNDSQQYSEFYGTNPYGGDEVHSLPRIPKPNTNLPYFDKNGNPTSGFVSFSTGGIHGSEYNKGLFEFDSEQAALENQTLNELIEAVRTEFPDATEMRKLCGRQPAFDEQGNPVLDKKGKQLQTRQMPLLDENGQEQYDKNGRLVKMSTNYIRLSDGRCVAHKDVLTTGSSPTKGATYKEASYVIPELFPKGKGQSWALNKKYVMTSVGLHIHEDFSSYYPNLLQNLNAFYNEPLGEDRYAMMYERKETLGAVAKDMSLTAKERLNAKISREGTKLILNSASGAGDTLYDTPIRMNNTIISMRLMGQMFSWWVGQAQAFINAIVSSTNTDGLYVTYAELDNDDDETVRKVLERNQEVLDKLAPIIGVDIEPEPLYIVSKDSNNRLELAYNEWGNTKRGDVLGASGGSLACYAGPSPDKSLNHPALTDYVLVEYMRACALKHTPPWRDTPLSIDEDFDEQAGRQIIQALLDQAGSIHSLLMFQNILSASNTTISYPFAADPPTPKQIETYKRELYDNEIANLRAKRPDDFPDRNTVPDEIRQSVLGKIESMNITESDVPVKYLNISPLQQHNRVFITKEGTPGTTHLYRASARKVSDVAVRRRQEQGVRETIHDPIALEILKANGISDRSDLIQNGYTPIPDQHDAVVTRVTNVDNTWHMLIDNRDIHEISEEERQEILASLDIEIYLAEAKSSFEKNWMVSTPGHLAGETDDDGDEDKE